MDHGERQQTTAGAGRGEDVVIDLGAIARRLGEHRHLFFYLVPLVVTLTAAVLLTLPDVYTSEATILPPTGGDNPIALISRLGAGGLDGSSRVSPTLYGEVFRSNRVLDAALAMRAGPDSVTFADHLRRQPRSWPWSMLGRGAVADDATPRAEHLLREAVKKRLRVDVDRIDHFVRVRFTDRDPELAAAFLTAVLERANGLMRLQLRAQATEKLDVLADRIAATGDSLRIAELELLDFRERNQAIAQSPKLMLEEARLRRTVELQQTVFIELRRQQELTTLEVVGDRRVLTTLDHPRVPAVKSGPFRARVMIVAGVAAFLATALFILVRKTPVYVACVEFGLAFAPRRWRERLRRSLLDRGVAPGLPTDH